MGYGTSGRVIGDPSTDESELAVVPGLAAALASDNFLLYRCCEEDKPSDFPADCEYEDAALAEPVIAA